MAKAIGVRFKCAGKVYYFNPNDLIINNGDKVIVETSRGIEYGSCVTKEVDLKDEEIISPLKDVLRVATKEDDDIHWENLKKAKEAMRICKEKVEEHNIDMKISSTEYTFDNNKLIFYFTSDDRVDFRELVKDLAAIFKTRIELRQIGVRDEAKMLGGIGNCGRGLCCSQWLADFQPVSIKMAKTQGLSLNPTKISGICGRLMCCLKYENDVYNEMRKGMPDNGEKVKTEAGMGIVVDTNILEDIVKVRLIIEGERDKYDRQKLGTEVFEYSKSEIKRISKTNKNYNNKKNDDVPEDVKALLKE